MAQDSDNNDILLEDNIDRHAAFNALTDNEKRRDFVSKEFNSGKFSDISHIYFFMKHYVKGEILLDSADEKAKLEKLLSGIDGFKGIQERKDAVISDILNKSLSYTEYATLGAEGMSVDAATTKTTDLGLADALKGIKKSQDKDEFSDLLLRAQKAAVNRQYNDVSDTSIYDLRNEVVAKKAQMKWYQFGKKRQLENANKNLDPSTYWSTKKVYGNMLTAPYYGLRGKLADRKSSKVRKLRDKLAKTTELQVRDASTRWLSKNFFTKLKTKTQLMFRRSPEKLTQKLLRNANISDLESYSSYLTKEIASLPANGITRSKLQQRGLDTHRKIMENIRLQCDNFKGSLASERDGILSSLNNEAAKHASPEEQRFVKNLNSYVAKLQKRAKENINALPEYQAYLMLHDGRIPENFNVEQAITADKIMDDILKANGITDAAKIEEIKNRFLPRNTEKETQSKPTAYNDKTVETEKTSDTNVVSKTNVGNVDTGGGLEFEEYIPQNDASYKDGNITQLDIAPDKSRYDFITVDTNGENREPTDAEIKAMIDRLAKDGITEIALEDTFSPEVQKKILEEISGREGMSVSNQKEIEERFAQETTREVKTEENANTDSVEAKVDDKAAAPVEKSALTSEGEKLSIEKVMINAISNSKTEEEQVARLKMIEQIQKGNFPQSGEEYIKFTNSISETFGKGGEDTSFLLNMTAAKALEKDMADEKTKDHNTEWLKDETEKANIKTKNQNQSANVCKIKETAQRFGDKINEEDPEFKAMSKDAQGAVRTIIEARGKADTPEKKQAAENQVIVKYLNTLHQRSSSKAKKSAAKTNNNTRPVVHSSQNTGR